MSTIDNVAANPGMTKENIRELTADELDGVTGAIDFCRSAAIDFCRSHNILPEPLMIS